MAAPGAKVAWVTGAAGFIGTHVRQRLTESGWKVIGIDRRMPGRRDSGTLIADVDNHSLGAAFDTAGPPQAVVHAAGSGSVGESTAHPQACRRDTLDSTRALVSFLADTAPGCRIVFASSAAVYGNAEDGPLSEDRPPAPISVYGEHKRAAEDVLCAAATRGQPVAILRMFSVYGPGLRKQLPWELAHKLLKGEGPVILNGTGAETRDFLAVEDAAGFLVDLATRPQPSPLIVNGGTGQAVTVATFAASLARALGVDRPIVFDGKTRPGDPRFYCADVQRLAALGLRATTDLATGLNAYVAWLRSLPPARKPPI